MATAKKSEALSVRIDPRMKYGLDLLARHQRRAVTGVVEWCLSEVFRVESVPGAKGRSYTIDDAIRITWSENELERLLALWFEFPTLLSYEESRMVNTLLRTLSLWVQFEPTRINNFRWNEVLPHWNKFKPVLAKAATRNPLVGLQEDDFKAAGIEHLWDALPF